MCSRGRSRERRPPPHSTHFVLSDNVHGAHALHYVPCALRVRFRRVQLASGCSLVLLLVLAPRSAREVSEVESGVVAARGAACARTMPVTGACGGGVAPQWRCEVELEPLGTGRRSPCSSTSDSRAPIVIRRSLLR